MEESGCLRDGIQPLAMVVPIGGMQAPCSNRSQWRFVERSGTGTSGRKLLGGSELLGGIAVDSGAAHTR